MHGGVCAHTNDAILTAVFQATVGGSGFTWRIRFLDIVSCVAELREQWLWKLTQLLLVYLVSSEVIIIHVVAKK
jgi:hypothetical protein